MFLSVFKEACNSLPLHKIFFAFMLIFLVGYMGCGKTTFGRELAKELGWQFADLDELIEERYKISIHNFFMKYGEENFRRIENMMLREQLPKHKMIVSTGGGTPCFYNNMDLMNRYGVTIFLNTPIPVLVDRLINGKRKRPLIMGLEKVELTIKINQHLAQRIRYYNMAQYKLGLEEQLASIVLERLGL
jgi:shikimate kinase